jgi:glycosyltransferase involved in cell wall biosynthesis
MKKLTVLHVNKFHYLKGGSEVVYFQTANVLAAHGHSNIFFSMHHPENQPSEASEFFVPYIDFNNLENVGSSIEGSLRILYYFKAKKLLSKLLDRYNIDIAHLHNVHHQISPSILHVLKSRGIPIVMTLHDYKMVCTSYNLLVEERPCEVCVRGNYYKAITYRCVKDSYYKSFLAAIEMYLHHKIMDIYDNVDVFIAPSLFLKDKLIEMGFKKEIVYLPNFIDSERFNTLDVIMNDTNEDEKTFVYFGRLTHGKGLITLLEAANLWLQNNKNVKVVVKIIGDGILKNDLQEIVKATAIHNVRFLGYMKGEELFREIKKSIAVIIPSEWYENNPMAVIEAFALGKPVIGSRIAGIPELVKDNYTGLTFQTKNAFDLYLKMKFIIENPDKTKLMGQYARTVVLQELNSEKYYEKLIGIYEQVLKKYHINLR